MPTYRTDTVTLPGTRPVHLLVCELCEGEVSTVNMPVPLVRLAASDVVLLWPNLKNEVARHEGDCRGEP